MRADDLNPKMIFDYAEEDWMLNGACAQGADPELWFCSPDDWRTKEAIAICKTCPVRVKCLTYALETDSAWGIWGATTEKQRRQIKENNDAA